MQRDRLGARGDGTADDTDALQRRLAEGGTVLLPRGAYRLTRPLHLDLGASGPAALVAEAGARLVMAAPGPAVRVVGGHSGSADPRSVSEDVWTRERMPLLDGLEIVGAHAEADGVEITRAMQATVTRLLVRRCRHGVRLSGRNRNVILSTCHLYHNRGVGLYLDGVNLHQVNVLGCHVSYNAGGGIVVRRSEIRNLQVVGNDIEYNHDPAAGESGDLWIETGEESVREASITGNTIQAIPSPGGANVRIRGRSGDARNKAGLISVCGNLISSQEVNIDLRWARGVVIEGNTFQTGTRAAVAAVESDSLVIGPNVFDRNADYPPSGRDGILIDRCRGIQLTGFMMSGCHAGSVEQGGCVEIVRSEDVSVHGLHLTDPQHRGIDIRDSRHCTVTGCHVRDRRPDPIMRQAVRVIGGGANWIAGNYLGRGAANALHLEAGSGLAENNHLA